MGNAGATSSVEDLERAGAGFGLVAGGAALDPANRLVQYIYKYL